MKFTSSCIIGAALISFAGLASADLKETENALEKIRNLKYIPKHKLQEDGAAEFGYGMAKVMWDKQHGGRCFGGLNSVINDFWPRVEDEVLETCYDRYCTLWPERAMDCADGAETFVQDLADECINKQDCDELGDLAAFEVSGIFCFSRAIQGRKKNFFPPLCRNRAKNVCEDIAVDITKELIWKKQCSDDKKLDFVEEQKLKANCGVVVKDLSQTAELERRNGYGYDACKRYNDNLGPDPYGNDPDPYSDNNGGNHYGNDPDPYYDNNGGGNHYDDHPGSGGNSGKHDNDPYYDDNRNKYDTTELP